MTQGDGARFLRRSVEAYYSEAMLLADEARSYFEAEGAAERNRLDGAARVHFACESLKVTTRLMHVIAWLLAQRAIAAGELTATDDTPAQRLGHAIDSDAEVMATLPAPAQAIVAASVDLFDAVARLDRRGHVVMAENPALVLHARLAAAF